MLVTFTPKHQKTYKQGLVLPFPIPDFNIQSFLSSGALDYELELNSIYPADSIKANFERLLYREPLLQDALVETKVYPYKNGSKIVLYVSIYGSMSVDGVIDLNAKLAEIKKQIQRVINS